MFYSFIWSLSPPGTHGAVPTYRVDTDLKTEWDFGHENTEQYDGGSTYRVIVVVQLIKMGVNNLFASRDTEFRISYSWIRKVVIESIVCGEWLKFNKTTYIVFSYVTCKQDVYKIVVDDIQSVYFCLPYLWQQFFGRYVTSYNTWNIISYTVP